MQWLLLVKEEYYLLFMQQPRRKGGGRVKEKYCVGRGLRDGRVPCCCLLGLFLFFIEKNGNQAKTIT